MQETHFLDKPSLAVTSARNTSMVTSQSLYISFRVTDPDKRYIYRRQDLLIIQRSITFIYLQKIKRAIYGYQCVRSTRDGTVRIHVYDYLVYQQSVQKVKFDASSIYNFCQGP